MASSILRISSDENWSIRDIDLERARCYSLDKFNQEARMSIFSNKLVVGIVCIVAGLLILPFLSLPTIVAWIIGIFLIVYGVVVLMGNK